MESWARIAEKCYNEAKKFQLICFYCSEVLRPENVNSECKFNEKNDYDEGKPKINLSIM
jgi:hypothetical protein